MTDNKKVVNIKFDARTKKKLETLAFLRAENLQSLCEKIIKEYINANIDAIEDAEKLRNQFKCGNTSKENNESKITYEDS